MSNFRSADESEDHLLSIVLYNAMLPLWNHNWFQGIKQSLPPVEVPKSADTALKFKQSCTALQQARMGFYHSVIKMTRLLDGWVDIATSKSTEFLEVHAISMWLPPHHQLGAFPLLTLYRSGFLKTMWDYGLGGVYRVLFVFEENVKKMFSKANLKVEDGAFVQMIAVNPMFAGNKYASELLWWQMQRHWETMPNVDVHLDTTTNQGIRAYERLGFKLLDTVEVNTGTDGEGIAIKKGSIDEAERRASGKATCKQRVMIMSNPNR